MAFYTVREFAEKHPITREMIYLLLQSGRLKKSTNPHNANDFRIFISEKDFFEYQDNRWKQYKRVNKCKARITFPTLTVGEIAKKYNVLPAKVYHLVKTGRLPNANHETPILIDIEDVTLFFKEK